MAASMTTEGLARQIEGTPWVYVGSGGDAPDFDPAWRNSGTYADMAFRLSNLDEVHLFGAVELTGDPAETEGIFTLTEGHRPASGRYGFFPVNTISAMGAAGFGMLLVPDTGLVSAVLPASAELGVLFIAGSFPLQPPDITP